MLKEEKVSQPVSTTSDTAPSAPAAPAATPSVSAAPNQFESIQSTLPPEPEGGKKKVFLIVLIVIFVLALVGGGIYIYQRTLSQKEASSGEGVVSPVETETTTPEATVAPESEPESEVELNRSDLKIQILNGSGIPGEAGKMQAVLEDAGYEEIETNNADSYDYEESEISIKKDKEDYLEMLTNDLSEDYALAVEANTLEEDSDYDAVIIVGKQ